MSGYYDKDGRPLTLDEWIARRRQGSVHVGNDSVGDAWVSTVWLGLDHNFSPYGPPLIFETMIFAGPHACFGPWRYSAKDEATAGHARVVELLRSGVKPEALT